MRFFFENGRPVYEGTPEEIDEFIRLTVNNQQNATPMVKINRDELMKKNKKEK